MAPFIREGTAYKEWTVHPTYVTTSWNNTVPGKTDCGKDECTVVQCTHLVGGIGVPLESFVFGFHAGSALAHLWYAVKSEQYYRTLLKHGNPLRWVEYAVTAALMIVVILVTMGIVAVWELVSAAVLTAATQFFGWLCEVSVQERPGQQSQTLYKYRWRFFWIGCFVALPPWIAIIVTYDDSRRNSDVPVPWFVTAIVIGLFIMFSSFAFVMVWRLRDRGGTPSELNVRAEKLYIILSFVSKALLAWLLWAGAFRRESIQLKQAEPPPCY